MSLRLLRNPMGMTLPGVMIGGSLLALLAMFAAEMFSQQGKALRNLRTQSNRDQLVATIARLAGNGQALNFSASAAANAGNFHDCSTGAVPNGCTAVSNTGFTLFDPQGNAVSGPNDTNAKLYTIDGEPCASGPASARCPIGVVTTYDSFCPASSPCTSAKTIVVKYSVKHLFVATGTLPLKTQEGQIASAVPFDTATAGTAGYIPRWTSTGVLGDSAIFQNASTGKIGIGTTSPLGNFEVDSSAAITPLVIQGGGNANVELIRIYDSTGNEAMRISSDRNVGINATAPAAKLDVGGEAKIGNTGLACGAGTAGAMRYNAGSVQYCNGTAWTNMSGGPSGSICGWSPGTVFGATCIWSMASISCDGHLPRTSCPSGYTRVLLNTDAACDPYVCVKN